MATAENTEAMRAAAAAARTGGTSNIGAQTSLTALASTLVRSARDVFVHTFEVAALESRLAGTSLATIVGIGFAIFVLALSAWGLLLAAGVRGLMEIGLGTGVSLLIAASANVLLAVLLGLLIPRLAKRMAFSATRRLLRRMGPDDETHAAH